MISDSVSIYEDSCKNHYFDLAVAVNPDKKNLDEMWTLLKPGGSSYMEWTSTFPVLSSKINHLKNAGFQNIKFYVTKSESGNGSSKVWIPLVENVILDYYSRYHNYKARKQIFAKAGQLLTRLGLKIYPKMFITFPRLLCNGSKNYKICSIASKSIKDPKKESVSQTQTVIDQNSDEKISSIIAVCLNKLNISKQAISIFILCEFSEINESVMLFVYTETRSSPAFVIKLPRPDMPASYQNNSIEILIALHEKFGLTQGLPRILFENRISGNFALAETFIDGISLSKKMTNKDYPKLAFKVTEWLVKLGEKTKSSSTESLGDGFKENIISNFINAYGSVLDPEEINHINIILSDLEPSFRLCVHNDLGPWNIQIDSNCVIGILDWESASLNGYPFTDLIMVLLWMSFKFQGAHKFGQYRLSYHNFVNPNTVSGQVVKKCMDHYAEKMKLSMSDIASYRLLTLLTQAQFEFPHLNSKIDKPNKDLNHIEKSFYLQLIKEELKLSNTY